MDDLIRRQDAVNEVVAWLKGRMSDKKNGKPLTDRINDLSSAQPDYQEVLGWLLAYHTMSFDLHGRYLPHEVISWLINDFTKEFIAERGQNE